MSQYWVEKKVRVPLTEATRQYSGSVILTEMRARISHPEDTIFEEGSMGAKKALQSLKTAEKKPGIVSLKYDGSVSIIFGRDDKGFSLTDKAGFSKSILPRNAQETYDMVFNRKPGDFGRDDYAKQFAGLFPFLNQIVPSNFKGFLQADVLWFKRPEIQDGKYQFQPNKIIYQIPVNSDTGRRVKHSQFGIAIHGFFKNPSQIEATPIDINNLKLNTIPQIVVLGSKIPSGQVTGIVDDAIDKLYKYVNENAKVIDDFLNPITLKNQQMSDFTSILKSFLAAKASSGQEAKGNLSQQCYKWISVNTNITEAKRTRMLQYIQSKKEAYFVIWRIVSRIVAIKTLLKTHFDKQTSGLISGLLAGQPGHEGFVIDGPSKIKLVNRPVFMNVENTPERYQKTK